MVSKSRVISESLYKAECHAQHWQTSKFIHSNGLLAGALDIESPKSNLVTKNTLQATIWTIFFMRKVVCISNCFPYFNGAEGIKFPSALNFAFWCFSSNKNSFRGSGGVSRGLDFGMPGRNSVRGNWPPLPPVASMGLHRRILAARIAFSTPKYCWSTKSYLRSNYN